MIKSIYRFFREIGIDFRKFKNLFGIYRYIRDFSRFKGLGGRISNIHMCLQDWNESSGSAGGHYFHQDLLIAQKIFKSNPKNHIDIGSRVDGFVAHVASFRKIDVLDIRPQKNNIQNINFIQGDLTSLDKNFYNSYDSVSCLHTLEHIGLGRYGDKLDIQGHIRAIENIKLIVQSNGTLYISVPISKNERTEFNAHRVFKIGTILKYFNDWKLVSFSYVDDQGNLHKNINLDENSKNNSFNLKFGLGIFELKNISRSKLRKPFK